MTGSGPELSAWVRGVGLWTLGYPDFASWVAAGTPDEFDPPLGREAGQPSAELLHPRLRRRTSLLTKMIVTALGEAAKVGGAAPDQTRYIVVSAWGEIETTVELLSQLAVPGGPISPTAFHNSVHNTATGYLSIASGNQSASTALAGGPHALEIGLIEACAGLRSTDTPTDVIVIFAEERLPAPFERADADPSFAFALHLGRELGGLALRLDLRAGPLGPDEPPPPPNELPSVARAARPLLRALATRTRALAIPLAYGGDAHVEQRWTVDLTPAEPRS